MSAQQELHSREKEFQHKPVDVYARYFRALSHAHLDQRRSEGKPVDSSHSEPHLNADANLIPIIGAAYALSDREIILGRFAAQFHDIVRSGREDTGLQDEIDSAKISVDILNDLNNRGDFLTTQEERSAVEYAVLNHSKPPAFFKDSQTRENIPDTLNDRLHTVLYVADALQKLGDPLVMRRSAFVGGKRRELGDLKDVSVDGVKIDAVEAVILESAVRLGWKNVESDYPQRLREHIQPAFAIQREWVGALLASKGLDIEGWANLIWNARNEKGQNILEFTSDTAANPPGSIEDIIEVLTSKGKISDDRIAEISLNADLVASSVEAVDYFSTNYAKDPESTLRNWNPQGKRAMIWKKGM